MLCETRMPDEPPSKMARMSTISTILLKYKPQRTDTQLEYVDPVKLAQITDTGRRSKPRPHCMVLLENCLRAIDERGFFHTHGYRTHGLCRFYCTGASVQHMPKGIRALLCDEKVADIDFERSAPTICLALAEHIGLQMHELTAIVADRDSWCAAANCTKDTVNKVMNTYGKNKESWSDKLLALKAESVLRAPRCRALPRHQR